MEGEGYQLLNISKELRQAFCELFKDMKQEEQVLTKDSEKPLVVHCMTRQMTYIKRGKGYVCINKNVFEICEGDLLIIGQNELHSFACVGDEMVLLHLHWPKENILDDRIVKQEFCDKFKFLYR